jgi:hypothetical protein
MGSLLLDSTVDLLDLFDNPVGYLTSHTISRPWAAKLLFFSGICLEEFVQKLKVSEQLYYVMDDESTTQEQAPRYVVSIKEYVVGLIPIEQGFTGFVPQQAAGY